MGNGVTTDVSVTTESKKEEPKKSSSDAWELGKKFTDLSNLSAQGNTKLVAFDPDKAKKSYVIIFDFILMINNVLNNILLMYI